MMHFRPDFTQVAYRNVSANAQPRTNYPCKSLQGKSFDSAAVFVTLFSVMQVTAFFLEWGNIKKAMPRVAVSSIPK